MNHYEAMDPNITFSIAKISRWLVRVGARNIWGPYIKDHGWGKKRGIQPVQPFLQQGYGEINDQAHKFSMNNKLGHIPIMA